MTVQRSPPLLVSKSGIHYNRILVSIYIYIILHVIILMIGVLHIFICIYRTFRSPLLNWKKHALGRGIIYTTIQNNSYM